MEIERPHRTTTTTTSDLFICFTSRLSHSSSMRLSTRSILSPGRAASGASAVVGGGDRSTSAVATTLSRRLRRNGSLRGGAQSPALFPATATTTKKSRGSSAFAENPEPSSPKVTCIGQVRVKTKKQGKKMKLRACGSKRIGGEASFRRIQQPPPPPPPTTDSPVRNPRWVHLPSSICETLKGFGSEFSCLLPCKSSCFSSNNNNNDNVNNNINNGNNRCLNSGNNGGSTTCGGVFRWWVSVEEGGGEGRRRDIELVVGGNDEEDDGVDRDRVRVMERECSRRRSIFDDVEFDDLFNGVANNVGSSEDKVEEDVVGRISVCVPPKNALLLMRCKSDPMRMASLSKKFLEASSFVECHSDGEDGFVEGKVRNRVDFGEVVGVKEEESEEIRDDLVEKMEEIEEVRAVEEVAEHRGEVIGDVEEKPCVENREETEEGQGVLVEENRNETEGGQSFENVDEDEQVTEMMEGENGVVDVVDEEVVDESEIWQVFIEMPRYEAMEVEEEEATGEEGPEELSSDSLTCCSPLEESKEVDINEDSVVEVVKEVVVVEDEEGRKSMEKEVNKSILPDCLLLMMCEPKLSMEVSKETWVRRSDFVRCLPERHLKQKPKQIDDVKDQPIVSTKKPKPAAVAAQPPLPPTAQTGIRPGRSSISFPTGGSTVAKKLAKVGVGVGVGVGYEPFVLPRCKSAPMRSAAKFGQPELACSMWGRENGRKLEPHRPATCGVGAAGVGF